MRISNVRLKFRVDLAVHFAAEKQISNAPT
jgi:hypothetical protein